MINRKGSQTPSRLFVNAAADHLHVAFTRRMKPQSIQVDQTPEQTCSSWRPSREQSNVQVRPESTSPRGYSSSDDLVGKSTDKRHYVNLTPRRFHQSDPAGPVEYGRIEYGGLPVTVDNSAY
jgi:hypothetical protein